MTNLHDLLVKRRSIRRFTDQPLNPDSVRLIIEAGLLAPTSKNCRAWQFVVVDKPEKLEALSRCKEAGAHPLAKCRLAVVVAVDSTKDDAWIEDASIAAGYMLLQATDLGLGGCWIQVRGRFAADGTPAEEVVREVTGLPEEMMVVCVLALGHPDEERKPQNTEKLLWEHVNIDTWKGTDQ